MTDQPQPFCIGRDAIREKAARPLKFRDIYIADWETWVRVCEISGLARDRFDARRAAKRGADAAKNLDGYRADLVIETAHDPVTGAKLFTAADAEWLNAAGVSALDAIVDVAHKVNGIGQRDMQELIEGFPTGRNGAGGSG